MDQGSDVENERPSIGKVLDVVHTIRTDVEVLKSDVRDLIDHEHRLRALEKRTWTLAGIATLGGAALGQIVEKLLA
jgi:hypothetical protein